MKHDSTTDAEKFLTAIHIDPKGPAKAKKAKKAKPEVDTHTMPADQIVFEPSMIERFTDLTSREAADYLFALYKSPHKDTPRNSLLWRRIGSFVADVRRQRQAGETGPIREKVKTSKGQRDLAQHLATLGLDGDDMPAIVKALKAAAAQKEG